VQSYFRYTHLVADDIIDVFEKHPLNKIKEDSQVTSSYLYKEKNAKL